MDTPAAVWVVELVNSAPVISHTGAVCVCVCVCVCVHTHYMIFGSLMTKSGMRDLLTSSQAGTLEGL